MVCPKCGSENTSIQMLNEIELKTKHRGLIWWVLVGWWWVPIKWLFLFFPALILKIFMPKKYKVINKEKKYLVCNNCGYSQEVK